MTNLDENVVPATGEPWLMASLRVALGTKGRLSRGAGAFPQCVQAGTERQPATKPHKVLFPLYVATRPRQIYGLTNYL